MYRFEKDPHRKILVLTIHGMQDGWEAKVMKSEWNDFIRTLGADWKFIVDLSNFTDIAKAAVKEQKRFSLAVGASPINTIFVVLPKDASLTEHILSGFTATSKADYVEAYMAAGGEDRTKTIAPPADGSHYPANTAPPM